MRLGLKRHLPPRLYDFLVMCRETAKTFGLGGLLREVIFRLSPSPDGLPFPTTRLVYLVVGHGSKRDFYLAGKTVVDDMFGHLHRCGVETAGFQSALDFGCGCGRLLRHIKTRTSGAIHGSDYNPALIDWCRSHLSFARFNVNTLEPALSYADKSFDYVYALSVFTHMSEENQRGWMRELRRIIRPSGVLFLTACGDEMAKVLPVEERAAYDRNEWVILQQGAEGSNYYTSFFSMTYALEGMFDGFEVLGHVPGREHPDLKQDIYILRRTS